MTDGRDDGNSAAPSEALIPVAQYLRMSTEHQRYSISIQSKTIARYARDHGMHVVQSYEDLGKSGLNIEGRAGLRRLLRDVRRPDVPFRSVLVHDISRWGRFQDPDEAASYEMECKRHGVRVYYCAEPFANDGSLASNIMVALKRSMAAEFSRELSAKAFAGHCESIEQGFRQGGRPGFGLSRQLIDEARQPKAILKTGERKYLQKQRVILVPSSESDRDMVNQIYSMLIDEDLPVRDIASRMNALQIYWSPDTMWTWSTIHEVLTNEKYMGTNLYNRTTARMKTLPKANPQDLWIRRKGAFEPLVSEARFLQVQAILAARRTRCGRDNMLRILEELLQKHGSLSTEILKLRPGTPSRLTYMSMFGTLRSAFRMVGYEPGRSTDFVEENRIARRLRPCIVNEIIVGIERAGGFAEFNAKANLLEVNGELTVSVVMATTGPTMGHRQWRAQRLKGSKGDFTILVRMDEGNEHIYDYYILPSIDNVLLAYPIREVNGRDLDVYRCWSLELFFALLARAPLGSTEPSSRKAIEVAQCVDRSLSIEYRFHNLANDPVNTYLAKMRSEELTLLCDQVGTKHLVFQRRSSDALSKLQHARQLLRKLGTDDEFMRLLALDGPPTAPEVLTCWGQYVEHV